MKAESMYMLKMLLLLSDLQVAAAKHAATAVWTRDPYRQEPLGPPSTLS
mgnify:CR=1 FL=1